MNVNDRGTMKWTSIMLPEQVQMLKDLDEEMDRKEKPILDEQQIAENGLKLQEALEKDLPISIKYFADYDYKITDDYLLGIDGRNKVVYMEEAVLHFDDIINVDIL